MYRKQFTRGLACLMTLFAMSQTAGAQDKITGPWLWMITPTAAGQGGAAATDVDLLAATSDGDVTEDMIAANGANEGDKVGNLEWTLGEIAPTGR